MKYAIKDSAIQFIQWIMLKSKLIAVKIKSKKYLFRRITFMKDVVLVVVKAAISFISLSFFMFANALYSGGMGIARLVAIKMVTQDKESQIKSYRYVGLIISVASISYILYSVRLFFGGETETYPIHIALLITLYTFIQFGINVREAVKLRKSKVLEAKALRAISLASTLLCFVLTQTAITSFATEGNNNFNNALSGVIFGGIAATIGFFIILDSYFYQN